MNISEATKLRIYELCDEWNISVNKLCDMSGITQSTISNIMSGRNGATVITIKKLCDGLDITIQDFFDSDLFRNLEQELQ